MAVKINFEGTAEELEIALDILSGALGESLDGEVEEQPEEPGGGDEEQVEDVLAELSEVARTISDSIKRSKGQEN